MMSKIEDFNIEKGNVLRCGLTVSKDLIDKAEIKYIRNNTLK